MNAVIRELKTEPVGIDHIRRAAPMAKVLLYDQIPEKLGSYDHIVRGKKCLIVLYQLHERGRAQDGMGHYALIQRVGKNKMLYFSSYGLAPEAEIKATHSSGRIMRLLGKNYTRNTVQLQRKFHTSTCGRWCILRAHLHDVPIKAFNKIFGQRQTSVDPDGLVCLSTMFLVK